MDLDKIAIIMTTYNNEDIIAATLESFLKQEYENLYLIITDDESKDNTPNIIKNYVEKNSKIILIEIPHGETVDFVVTSGCYNKIYDLAHQP